MGGIAMIVGIIIFVALILLGLIQNISKQCNEDRGYRAINFVFSMVFSILLGMILNTLTTPTIEDYIHGKVQIEIKQIYKNGEFVRCDTNYYKL